MRRMLEEARGSWGRERVWFGALPVDPLTFGEALDAIEALVSRGQGGAVFLPDVDHVVLAEQDPRVQEAYAAASLCLADGVALLWAARMLGTPLPGKVSGAELMLPLMWRAVERRWRVYLLGTRPDVTAKAATRLRNELGVDVAGLDSLPATEPCHAEARPPVVERVHEARPHLLLVGLETPRQELWLHHARPTLGPVVALGLGAGLESYADSTLRAPSWMSQSGLEWLHELARKPRQLWRRSLLREPEFAFTLWRALRNRRGHGQPGSPR